MSELKTNKISTNDQNNVAIDNALGLKSYDTADRDALTSVAGDLIYNSDDNKVQVHNGSAWEDVGAGIEGFQVQYLVVGGGGAGAYRYDAQRAAGAGGAGGFRNSTTGEQTGHPLTNPEPKFLTALSTNYTITIGAGGTGGTYSSSSGADSKFGDIVGAGGGRGSSAFTGRAGGISGSDKTQAGSGGGGQIGSYASGDDRGGGGSYGQGGAGSSRGGGGGAGGDGSNPTGGTGKSSAITGSSVTYATGGTGNSNATGSANTGDGGGSNSSNGQPGLAGGSGIVALKWLTADATIGATRTGLTDGGVQTSGDYSYIVFTQGTGTISFS